MRLFPAIACVAALAACDGSGNVDLPLRSAALQDATVSPVGATFRGQARLTQQAPAITSLDLLFVEINGSVLRLDGIENAALSFEEARDAAVEVEAFLAQGPATCVTGQDGNASCVVGGFDMARFLTARVFALPG
ncbi:hypothetical protein [Pontivivens insulae]|uniref:Uncharacterized protein n=1 Tax=Pontivivens insulae TaxID=1639689 RepID=A0A2R8AAI4_9RHOB|nr:hypothetical protein [Pontivivens insulae]RED13129.1 hypothetical protein DFR53_2264 [Pontivivens insulae]SPF29221.1 hypothetical protein POI8812_01528 [Pontivivens insulae]